MPLDIELNTEIPRVRVLSSETVELVCAMQLLADIKHHQFAKDWANNIYSRLSEKSLTLLRGISNLRMQGLELLEFILEERIFDDVEKFINKLSASENDDFISKITGEELDFDEIKKIRENEKYLSVIEEEKPWLVRGSFNIIKDLFNKTEELKADLAELLQEIYSSEFKEKIKEISIEYHMEIDKLNQKLMKKKPLDAAQEIMGKKFVRVFNFKEYFFIPSYFISPHNIRTFNQRAQMLVYDFRNYMKSKNELSGKLSANLKVLSDKTRLEILRLLISNSNYGKNIASRLDLTTATISHHLEQLKSVNLVTEDREKNFKIFSANVEEIDKLLESIKDYLYNK